MLSWQKIVNLIGKTHDKVIIMDEKTEQAYVVMPYSEYEKSSDDFEPGKVLTQDESLDRINRDIAMLQSDYIEPVDNVFIDVEKEDKSDSEDYYYIEPVE